MTHSLVIGGTKGLGRVVARQLAQRGDFISVFGRSGVPIADQSAGSIDSYKLDINDSLAVAEGLKEIITKRGDLNYWIFLQRFRGNGDDWAGEIQTTLTATKSVVEIIVPHMAPKGDNALLMVSSVFAKYVGEGQGVSYHVAKFINFFGIKDLITCVIDDHPKKVGMYMPGSGLPIISSAQLKKLSIR